MQKKKINYLARNKKIFKNCKMINLHNPEKKDKEKLIYERMIWLLKKRS